MSSMNGLVRGAKGGEARRGRASVSMSMRDICLQNCRNKLVLVCTYYNRSSSIAIAGAHVTRAHASFVLHGAWWL
eukprot:scaffold198483_cov31-Tisochrysis_lutea.AAC.1